MDALESFFDPFGVGSSFLKVQQAWMKNNLDQFGMLSKLNTDAQSLGIEELIPLLFEAVASAPRGASADPEATLLDRVRRCSKLSQKLHAAWGAWLKDHVDKSGLSGKDREYSMFWANQMISALHPSNFFWTNPSAVQKCIRTRGESLVKGMQNWLEDINRGDKMVKIADMDAFKVGENLATTPGFVVFRNDLIELIQYIPTTESTHAVPLVFIQPCINKYYIFDLDKEKSFVRFLLDQGFSVFMVSWKNPTKEMRDFTFDDYIFRGALKAIEVTREICNVEKVHAAGFCIGGTTLATLMAWLNRGPAGEESMPVKDWTLFATMVDYSEPGELGAYISENVIREVERLMERDGYLDGNLMALAFRLLRPDNLIWRYHAHNYLQGEKPPKSDFLYWNSDPTRLPKAMGSFYLREFYTNNKLIEKDSLVLGDRPIDLKRIQQPLYAVGTHQDHICPWKSTFKIANLVSGPVRYALAAEGHIAGIVNPPSARGKKKFWASDVGEQTSPDEWLSSQPEQHGSWWVDWVKWLSERCGSRESPPPMGSGQYPPLDRAPGMYVLEK